MLLASRFSHPPVRPSHHLQASLRAALASHRPAALKILFDQHGECRFALALSGLSQRAIADALSMLPATDRANTHKYLPNSLRHSLGTLPTLPHHALSSAACVTHPNNRNAMPHTAAARM